MLTMSFTFSCAAAAQWAVCSAGVSYFDGSSQTNYLNIYRTDLRQIFRVDRTLDVDDESDVFRSLKGRCRGNQFLLALSSTELSSGVIR